MDYVRSFRHFIEELLENLFHFEGKFLVSVAWLLAKPGRLTKEFVSGRRQSQLNPLRFYIFATVLFFLGVHLLNHGHLFDFDRAEADRITREAPAETVKWVDGKSSADVAEVRKELKAIANETGVVDPKAIAAIVEAEKKRARQMEDEPKAAAHPGTAAPAKVAAPAFWVTLNQELSSGTVRFSQLVDEIERRVPTILFIGMPIFALILKLRYLGSGRYYLEHLVFSLHLHTWAFLALMVGNGYMKLAALGPHVLSALVGWAVAGWIVWYLVQSFRTVYGQSWVRSIVTALAVGAAYSVALFLVAVTVITLTIALMIMEHGAH